jgi:thiol-disulfide isomerase/thioredoxin
MNGQMQSLTQFNGQPVVLNFWATWCPPCIREMPLLDDWHARRGADGLTVVAIALETDANLVAEFVNSRGLTLPVWIAEPGIGDLSAQFGNRRNVLPFSVLLGADGEVLERHAGELSEAILAGWRQSSQAD